jgi:hypothetical protein
VLLESLVAGVTTLRCPPACLTRLSPSCWPARPLSHPCRDRRGQACSSLSSRFPGLRRHRIMGRSIDLPAEPGAARRPRARPLGRRGSARAPSKPGANLAANYSSASIGSPALSAAANASNGAAVPFTRTTCESVSTAASCSYRTADASSRASPPKNLHRAGGAFAGTAGAVQMAGEVAR